MTIQWLLGSQPRKWAADYPRPVNIRGREVVKRVEMARPLFWALAGLLLASAPAGATDEICELTQQQQKAGQPPAGRLEEIIFIWKPLPAKPMP